MNAEDQVAQGEVTEHDALLRAYLGGHDEPCPMCEYNLRGLTGTVCPECGEALRLRVSLSEPKMAAYLCGLIGLSVGVGFTSVSKAGLQPNLPRCVGTASGPSRVRCDRLSVDRPHTLQDRGRVVQSAIPRFTGALHLLLARVSAWSTGGDPARAATSSESARRV
ncbi:MAG: hypothetical protein IIB55_07145 [Planctomycetes bacterium]|nr:hypothetical protein [Planctomycetota bacterium]